MANAPKNVHISFGNTSLIPHQPFDLCLAALDEHVVLLSKPPVVVAVDSAEDQQPRVLVHHLGRELDCVLVFTGICVDAKWLDARQKNIPSLFWVLPISAKGF